MDIICIGHITSYLASNVHSVLHGFILVMDIIFFGHILHSFVLAVDIIFVGPMASYLASNFHPIFNIYFSSVSG